MNEPRCVFLLGCQRSGTTILSQCLGLHPSIANFYEPYYLWDKLLNGCEDDIPRSENFTDSFQRKIRNEFAHFALKARKPLVLDKSPEHCFKVAFVSKVFPESKWIHILRDGRAVTLSIHKEWLKRKRMVEERRLSDLIQIMRRSFRLQPYWHFRIKQIFYELHRPLRPTAWLSMNKSKWKGRAGWGPRFSGWQECLESRSLLQFNATQWVETVRQAQEGLKQISPEQIFEVRYEEFLRAPHQTLLEILEFLDLPCPDTYLNSIPRIDPTPLHKWKKEFSQCQLKEVGTILNEKLAEMNYNSV